MVGTPVELDPTMLLGVGSRRTPGGALQYADWLGLEEVVARYGRLRTLGSAFESTERMREMAALGQHFHPIQSSQSVAVQDEI